MENETLIPGDTQGDNNTVFVCLNIRNSTETPQHPLSVQDAPLNSPREEDSDVKDEITTSASPQDPSERTCLLFHPNNAQGSAWRKAAGTQ